MEAATLVKRAREHAGLSRRALATRVGVPTSTISRIEDGSSDPTLTMLTRVLSAAGKNLTISLSDTDARPSIATLTRFLHPATAHEPRRIEWTGLRSFLDQLAHNPGLIEDAIQAPPPRTGDDQCDALLASIAEKIADDHNLARPRWTRTVPAASTPWEPPGTPRTIAKARAETPPQLAARNIYLSARDLSRTRA